MKEPIAHAGPFCIETMHKHVGTPSGLLNTISSLVEQLNSVIQTVRPEVSLELVNQVDEITPCNADLLKFYIAVKTND